MAGKFAWLRSRPTRGKLFRSFGPTAVAAAGVITIQIVVAVIAARSTCDPGGARCFPRHGAPHGHNLTLWSPTRSGRFDVGVEAEEVRGIVTLLERGEPRIVAAISGLDARFNRPAGIAVIALAPTTRLTSPPCPAPVDTKPRLQSELAARRGTQPPLRKPWAQPCAG